MYLPNLTWKDLDKCIGHVSASQINTILACKFKWASQYVYKLPSRPKKGQMLGIGIFLHDWAKKVSLGNANFDKQAMLEGLSKVEDSKLLPKDWYGHIIDIFISNYGQYNFTNENTEVYFSKKLPGVDANIIGFVDHITDNKIIDLKIKGSLEKINGSLSFTMNEYVQQGLYSYFMGIPDTELDILYINRRKKEKEIEFFKIPKRFEEVDYQRINLIVKSAIKDMYSLNYPPNRLFKWCSSNMCEYWDTCHEIWG